MANLCDVCKKELSKPNDPRYPKIRYHKDRAPQGKRVECESDDKALGDGWVESPSEFLKQEPKQEEQKAPVKAVGKKSINEVRT